MASRNATVAVAALFILLTVMTPHAYCTFERKFMSSFATLIGAVTSCAAPSQGLTGVVFNHSFHSCDHVECRQTEADRAANVRLKESLVKQLHASEDAEEIAHLMTETVNRKYYVSTINVDGTQQHCTASPAVIYRDLPFQVFTDERGQTQTISAPHMHAFALNLLFPVLRPGAKVLDVGSGSGYLTVCFARLVGLSVANEADATNGEEGTRGVVVGIELYPELNRLSLSNVASDPNNCWLLGLKNFRLEAGDITRGIDGARNELFDAIHVGASTSNLVVQETLLPLLANGGRLVAPIGHDFRMYKKEGNKVTTEDVLAVNYVSLQHADGSRGVKARVNIPS